MDISQDEIQILELFAAACEQLNDYARNLRSSGRFFDVRTRADIRNYESGWRLEKCIEADIHKGGVSHGGYCAEWCLELGPAEPSGLMLQAYLYVNPEGNEISLPTRTANTLSEFKEAIATVVNELQAALETNDEFIHAIETAKH